MALTDLTIIRRSLTARLFSTVTTVLTVAVAVALMLVLLLMRDSGRKVFERGTGNMQILVSADSSPLVSVLNSVFYANAPQRPLTLTKYFTLFPRDADGNINDRRVEFALPVQQGDSFRGFPTMAIDPPFFALFQPVVGEPFGFSAGGPINGDFDVVLGSDVAAATGFGVGRKLFVTHGYSARRGHAVAVGDTPETARGGAHHHHHPESTTDAEKPWRPEPEKGAEEDIHADFPFAVVGVLKPTGSAHDRAVFIHLHATWLMHAAEKRHAADEGKPSAPPTVADLTDAEKLITGVYVGIRTRQGSDVSAAAGPVFAQLRADPTLTVALPGQEIRRLFDIVSNVDRVIIAIAAAVLVSSGIAILLALYNSMEQRRRQIAVLRVLGASRARVFGLVITESALIGLFGAVGGVLMCLVSMQAVVLVFKERLGLVLSAAPNAEVMLPVLGATVVLSALAGVFPAALAYRTSVSRALRPSA
ncbi:MAG: ABC transporter permease [Phycisphaerales bacterium]